MNTKSKKIKAVTKAKVAASLQSLWRTRCADSFTIIELAAIETFLARKGLDTRRGGSTDAIAAVVVSWPTEIDDEVDVRLTALLAVALRGNCAAQLVLFHAISRLGLHHICSAEVVTSWWLQLRTNDQIAAKAARQHSAVRLAMVDRWPLAPEM